MENRRIRMTRKLIRGALIELLQEKTIDKISVKEICARADVNRSTFYDHYEDIYALLGDMEAEFISQIPQEYASASIRAQLLGFVRYVRDHQQLYAAIRKYSDMVRKRLIPLILQNYISEMQPEGAKPRATELCVVYVVNGSACLLDDWIRRGCDLSLDDMTDLLMRFAYGAFNSLN